TGVGGCRLERRGIELLGLGLYAWRRRAIPALHQLVRWRAGPQHGSEADGEQQGQRDEECAPLPGGGLHGSALEHSYRSGIGYSRRRIADGAFRGRFNATAAARATLL